MDEEDEEDKSDEIKVRIANYIEKSDEIRQLTLEQLSGSRQLLTAWKKHGLGLEHVMRTQLKACADLTSTDTIKGLVHHSKSREMRERTTEVALFLRGDIRLLFQYRWNVLAPMDKEGWTMLDDREWAKRNRELEQRLADLGFIHHNTNRAEIPLEHLVFLLEMRTVEFLKVMDALRRYKQSLDQDLGILPSHGLGPALTAKEREFHQYFDSNFTASTCSNEVKKLVLHCQSFFGLCRISRSLREAREGIVHAQIVRKLEHEMDDLQADLDASNDKLKEMEAKYNILVEGSNEGNRDLIDLEQKEMTIRRLEDRIKLVEYNNLELVGEKGRLNDRIISLEQEVRTMRQLHEKEIDQTIPKIRRMEETYEQMIRAMDGLKLDVDLVSGIYRARDDEMIDLSDQINEERKNNDNAQEYIKKLKIDIQELTINARKKEKLALLAITARDTITKEYQQVKEENVKQIEQITNLEMTLSAKDERIRLLEEIRTQNEEKIEEYRGKYFAKNNELDKVKSEFQRKEVVLVELIEKNERELSDGMNEEARKRFEELEKRNADLMNAKRRVEDQLESALAKIYEMEIARTNWR